MEPHLETTATIAESVRMVEVDADSERCRATYVSSRDSTSLAVTAVVGAALGKDQLDLTPLQSVIDTDALDELTTESSVGLASCDSVTFQYEGLEVTVWSDGVIETEPSENSGIDASASH